MADPNKNNNNSRNTNGKSNHNGSAPEKTIRNRQAAEQQQQQVVAPANLRTDISPAPLPINAFNRPNVGERFYLWCQDCMRRLRGEALRHTATTGPTQFAPDAGNNTRKPGDATTSASEDNESQSSKPENPNARQKQSKPKESWLSAAKRKIRSKISSKMECEGVYPYYTHFIN